MTCVIRTRSKSAAPPTSRNSSPFLHSTFGPTMLSPLAKILWLCLSASAQNHNQVQDLPTDFPDLSSRTISTDLPTDATTTPPETWRVQPGEFCNAKSFPLPAIERNQFYQCTVPTEDEAAWPWKEVGVWVLLTCGAGEIFSPVNKTCVDREKSVRRFPVPGICSTQPSLTICGPPAPPVIPVPCPHATQNGASACPGCPCSWMLAPLTIDPNTPAGYLQCAPAFPGIYCGVWTPMPCAPGTRFDVVVQVCVHDECAAPPCGVPAGIGYGIGGGGYGVGGYGGGGFGGGGCGAGLVVIGPCNSGFACPGSAVCTANVCCGGGGGFGFRK